MIINYYKSNDLSYANRKRYKTFNYVPDSTEQQNAVKLGDGARTTIKTSVSNLCNYVKIDNTRWYVVSFRYVNGGQVILNLQRDVVGEFGLTDCIGKIERGYTETFLRNRKELDLNQRLIDRIPVIPNSLEYGNYKVNTHNNEKWGILYISKPTDGTEYANIPIPAFSPKNYNSSLEYIENGTIKYLNNNFSSNIRFYMTDEIFHRFIFRCTINFYYNQTSGEYYYNYEVFQVNESFRDKCICDFSTGSYDINDSFWTKKVCEFYVDDIAKRIIYNKLNNVVQENKAFSLADCYKKNITNDVVNLYNNSCVLYKGLYYNYIVTETIETVNGNTNNGFEFWSRIISHLEETHTFEYNGTSYTFSEYSQRYEGYSSYIEETTSNIITKELFNSSQISPSESGVLVIDLTQDLVDEPYIIYAIPLFDTTIKDVATDGTTFIKNVTQSNAFLTFNTAIQYLSGENAYLVDAQIYPYCPNLRDYNVSVNNIPVFTVMQTSFERVCSIKLNQYCDIKKEYIKRVYSINAPDQSNKFSFNYYDYYNDVIPNNTNDKISDSITTIIIKSALKPFNIISSAVIIPNDNSLIGKTYESDLRGCVSVSSGFECSISTDQFQQYVRNNVNYEKLFEKDKLELQKQHNVERVNDAVSTIVNTASATAMGAIAGGAMADAGIWNSFGTTSAGAITGGAIAGSTVGLAMSGQSIANESLRKYEETLQQERFDLTIGTIKNLPNQISRISSFNEIIMRNFYYVIEVYECSNEESLLVDDFIEKYSYGLGVIGLYSKFIKDKWFVRGTLISSSLYPILHTVLNNELKGGIYYNE